MTSEFLLQELQDRLGMKSPKVEREFRIQGEGRAFIVDLMMEDQRSIFFIEVKRRLTPEAIARFFEAKEWITKSLNSLKEKIFLVAAQYVDPTSQRMANLLGIRVDKISISRSDLGIGSHSESLKIKITANKAWEVVISLLKYQPTSIYNVMKKSGVSYGESHRVISYLRNRDLLTQKGNFVSVTDIRPILNAAFWERPLKSLMLKEYNIRYDTFEDIPWAISDLLERNGIKHAFTGIAAYERYFGGVRNESSYDIYVDKSNPFFNDLITEFTSSDEKNAKLSVYKTDRDVFSGSTKIGDVILVSKEQLLLDLAGGDKITLQLASEMVKKLDKL